MLFIFERLVDFFAKKICFRDNKFFFILTLLFSYMNDKIQNNVIHTKNVTSKKKKN
jgi:hypothetical protein